MRTSSTPEGTPNTGDTARSGGTRSGGDPVAPDRPVVDGATMSVEELEAEIEIESEIEELGDERHQEVDELRAEVGATATELTARFDVAERARAGRDETVAALRTAAAGASARAGWRGPAAIAAVTVLVVLLVRRRSRGREACGVEI
ncbi:hypothetical protein [Pseudonocardia sp. MH-G8]|uniref:hypothetical protein n=1 Tax=Pseudonocardia sp. MH-G8 TaxID=1854588 RepID=UPI000BA082B2|nr:hypothetical protein [Pseudonocardia sp. MH-G8]OZM78735.1 hypothetical protein CFP66_29270 [Pseudonocardia sp. MH-G8]